jgi:glucose-1-phosphate thymidylyltransferase
VDVTAVLIVDSAKGSVGRSQSPPRLTALEHVANRPIVHHVLDGLQQAHIGRLIVAGEPDALIDVQASVAAYEPRFPGLDYALCRDGTDLHSTLETVAPLVGNAPCLIHPADGLFDGLLDPSEWPHGASEHAEADVVLYVSGSVAGSASSVQRSSSGRLLGPAISAATGQSTEGFTEIALFGPGMLSRARDSFGGWGDLADTGAKMAASGATVRVKHVDGWRRYRGDGRDLLELNRVALDRLTATAPGPVHETNRVEGRVQVDPTADVRDSVIIGPTVIGPGATVSQSYIGPYTSVGEGARIEGTEIERSIVASGACVSHVGVRLVSSLVGRNARIFRDFALPRALRLWLGDGDEVALC